MPITSRYVLVCDEVRKEDNGKLIIIGLYTPNILIPQLPFTFPSLTFFNAFESSQAGRFQFSARLRHTESGQELAQAMGLLEVAQPGVGLAVIRFGNLQVDRVGLFDFVMQFTGQPDPISTSFEIVLQAVQPRR